MPTKILSDFDGVWTDQALEAKSVLFFMIAEAARLARVPANRALADFTEFEALAQARPAEFGWAPDGRITAYVDEDPFCVANSIAAWLTASSDEREVLYREAVLDAGHETLTAFADHCFHTATENYRNLHPPALVPDALEVFDALRRAGAEVVVVSNSSPSKLIDWFRASGIDAGEDASHALRVRGSAGKFVLGETDASLEIAGRRIFVDRPKYRAIIGEEDPDVVIGDVYSLDLALPHAMREEGAAGAPRRLILRGHEHTPSWVRDDRAEGTIDRVVEGVADLVDECSEVTA
ncbi:MAG: hypothetical protein ACYSWX_06515 [Planctomycetota bacterium]|jgi:FMN phosphatase YigB (HAD superfamily)